MAFKVLLGLQVPKVILALILKYLGLLAFRELLAQLVLKVIPVI